VRNDFREPPLRPPRHLRFSLRTLLAAAVLVCLAAFAAKWLGARHIAALLGALAFGVTVALVVQAASRRKVLSAALGTLFACGSLALTVEMAQPVPWARTTWVPLTIRVVDRDTGRPLEQVRLILCPKVDHGRWVEGETDADGIAKLIGEFHSSGEDTLIAAHGRVRFSEYQLVVARPGPNTVFELSDLIGDSQDIHDPHPEPFELSVPVK